MEYTFARLKETREVESLEEVSPFDIQMVLEEKDRLDIWERYWTNTQTNFNSGFAGLKEAVSWKKWLNWGTL